MIFRTREQAQEMLKAESGRRVTLLVSKQHVSKPPAKSAVSGLGGLGKTSRPRDLREEPSQQRTTFVCDGAVLAVDKSVKHQPYQWLPVSLL